MSQTIHRATELINFVAMEPRTLAEASSHFDVHRSTIFRQLRVLEQAGFLLRRSDNRYVIGPRLIDVAQLALEQIDLRQVARPHLATLHREVGGTVHLAQLMEDRIVYVDKLEDPDGVRMYSRIGKTVQPHATAVGKCVLSELSPERRDATLRDVDWTAYTPRTLVTRESLDEQLAEIAERKWAVDDSEFEDFTNCIAATVTNSNGSIIGAVSISSLTAIRNLPTLETHRDVLLGTASAISKDLA